MSQPTCRAETNRANAQNSTGPKSAIGKLRSSQNSFQHGLYSKQLILPDEDPAEFDHLRATLRDEHQPANTVEEILVDELSQHFWRMRRFRELEARALQPENLDTWCNNGLFALIERSMASAELLLPQISCRFASASEAHRPRARAVKQKQQLG